MAHGVAVGAPAAATVCVVFGNEYMRNDDAPAEYKCDDLDPESDNSPGFMTFTSSEGGDKTARSVILVLLFPQLVTSMATPMLTSSSELLALTMALAWYTSCLANLITGRKRRIQRRPCLSFHPYDEVRLVQLSQVPGTYITMVLTTFLLVRPTALTVRLRSPAPPMLFLVLLAWFRRMPVLMFACWMAAMVLLLLVLILERRPVRLSLLAHLMSIMTALTI